MSRSRWKGNFIKFINRNSRNFIVSKNLLNSKILIHNGKILKEIICSSVFIGQKTGNFIFTRKFKSKKK